MGKLRGHVRGNVVGYIALFFALGLGSAWAATELDKNEVKSKHLKNGGVKTKDLANDAVTSPKVGNGSLLGEDFAAGQLPQGPEGPQGVQGPEGPAGADGAPGAPGAPGATNTLTRVATCTVIDDNPGVEHSCNSPPCTTAEELTGGGASLRNFNSTLNTHVTESYPNTNFFNPDTTVDEWRGGAINNSGADVQLTVWAVCASP